MVQICQRFLVGCCLVISLMAPLNAQAPAIENADLDVRPAVRYSYYFNAPQGPNVSLAATGCLLLRGFDFGDQCELAAAAYNHSLLLAF